MDEWKKDVVRITYRTEGRVGVSTGYAVAPDKILTALHVAYDKTSGKLRPELSVRLAHVGIGEGVRVKECWPPAHDEGAPDVAVLELEESLQVSGPRLPLIPRLIGADRWQTRGFPSGCLPKDAAPDRAPEDISGTTESLMEVDHRLQLVAGHTAWHWHGLSGGPVVIRESVVGVVASANAPFASKLYATPLWRLRETDDFWTTLGLETGGCQAGVAKDLCGVREGALALLVGRDDLVARLATALSRPATNDPAVLVDVLLHTVSARDVARAVDHLDDELAPQPSRLQDRRALRDLFWLLIPFSVDWRAHAGLIRAAVEDKQRVIEVPYCTLSVAEVIMAGADGMRVQWKVDAPVGQPLMGQGAIRLPPKLLVPSLGPGLIRQQIEEDLARRLIIDAVDGEKRRELINRRLASRFGSPRSTRQRYYLAFVDLEHGQEKDARLSLAVQALDGLSDTLRLVRLSGDGSDEEEDILTAMLGIVDLQGHRKERTE